MLLMTTLIHRILPHLIAFLSGIASWYGTGVGIHGCAMTMKPRGTIVYIQNVRNHLRSWCRVNDSGPYVAGRVIDVSPYIAQELGFYRSGLAPVRLYVKTRR